MFCAFFAAPQHPFSASLHFLSSSYGAADGEGSLRAQAGLGMKRQGIWQNAYPFLISGLAMLLAARRISSFGAF
ncbi:MULTISPECIES: hypothetical protein [Pseudomonas]|uniref:hypothetical protein n=1 Tax=Pseudomonas TaxID=286 RepID=UPI0011B26FE6|nr:MULTISPECIES: hypothetical protein [Pseudomonas]ULT68801.1 hypothetical protein L1O02_20625 [Pseudomonas sp. BC42]